MLSYMMRCASISAAATLCNSICIVYYTENQLAVAKSDRECDMKISENKSSSFTSNTFQLISWYFGFWLTYSVRLPCVYQII